MYQAGHRPPQRAQGQRAWPAATCGKGFLTNLLWPLGTCAHMTPSWRLGSTQHLGVIHVISEMLQTLTKILSVLILQVQQLLIGEGHQLPQGCGIGDGASDGQCPPNALFLPAADTKPHPPSGLGGHSQAWHRAEEAHEQKRHAAEAGL